MSNATQNTDSPAFDTLAFRRALGSFLTGVTVVTTRDPDGQPVGFTANSFTSVSLTPPLVLVCIAKSAGLATVFAKANHYAINILAESQQGLSETFASPASDRFAGVAWQASQHHSPLLDGAAAWLDCAAHQLIDAGDHLILLAEVVDFARSQTSPLGYLRGNYLHLSLQQTAARALEDPQQSTRVGILLESDKTILLKVDQDGRLWLPSAPRLGRSNEADSLLGHLARWALTPREKILFSVYEDVPNDAIAIYYRARLPTNKRPAVESLADAGLGYYPFAKLPFDRFADAAEITMLKRYIKERETDAFGVYVGDQRAGDVQFQPTHLPEDNEAKR